MNNRSENEDPHPLNSVAEEITPPISEEGESQLEEGTAEGLTPGEDEVPLAEMDSPIESEAAELQAAPEPTDAILDEQDEEVPSWVDRFPADLMEQIGQLGSAMAGLHKTFEEKIRYDSSREAIIERLHTEIQEYRADLLLKLTKPFVLGLINLHDDCGKTIAACRIKSKEDASHLKWLDTLQDFQLDIEDLLCRNGYESFTVSDGDSDSPLLFDPKQQRALKKVPTEDPDLNRVVAESLRKGFRYEDRVVRPELVSVYVWEKSSVAQS